jgi:DNA-binding NtrC family response regulator
MVPDAFATTDNRAHAKTAAPARDEMFVFIERGRELPEAVRRTLAAHGLAARVVCEPALLARLLNGATGGVAVVAAAEEPGPATFEAVALLKGRDYTVLCVCDGARGWVLGAQCRLLLAGATELVDGEVLFEMGGLHRHLSRLLEAEAARRREGRRARERMAALGVVGNSPAIQDVYRWVQCAGPLSDLAVLISGETGTGKELAARALHRLDPRRSSGPFVAVNCGAISPGLAESELFGHRRGAFTGAEQARKGLVRAASGGVLFLDEIGDLDLGLQGKLLRVLQERRVLSLGHDEETPVDVRIVAATHRDLEAMVREGKFRADLFHRLNVLSVRLPALRERPEDVELLVRHFMARCTGQPEGTVSASQDFLLALSRVELPGNVRQLENLVRRAMLGWRPGEPLRLSDLPPELWQELAHLSRAGGAAGAGPGVPEPVRAAGPDAPFDAVRLLEACDWQLERALSLCERRIVDAALGASSGNRSRAARLLGISPRSIFNKLRK